MKDKFNASKTLGKQKRTKHIERYLKKIRVCESTRRQGLSENLSDFIIGQFPIISWTSTKLTLPSKTICPCLSK